jgi:hypothetical protein
MPPTNLAPRRAGNHERSVKSSAGYWKYFR